VKLFQGREDININHKVKVSGLSCKYQSLFSLSTEMDIGVPSFQISKLFKQYFERNNNLRRMKITIGVNLSNYVGPDDVWQISLLDRHELIDLDEYISIIRSIPFTLDKFVFQCWFLEFPLKWLELLNVIATVPAKLIVLDFLDSVHIRNFPKSILDQNLRLLFLGNQVVQRVVISGTHDKSSREFLFNR
jgi:hypothetical protein